MKKVIEKLKNKRGFVILFAVTISAILLSIALGVANVALKEVSFSTSAKDTNDAFFAADTAIECALYYDGTSPTTFPVAGPATAISCATATPTFATDSNNTSYTFTVAGLGSSLQSCAVVKITKNKIAHPSPTTIVSTGYNIGSGNNCTSTNPNRVEREIKTTYNGSL